ncbi:MAG: sigma-54 dependent transcriptional regulator [Pseudomonadota bacterium]
MAHDILVVDDEADIRLLLSGILNDEGYKTRQAANADAALEAFGSGVPSLVILDVWLQNSRLDGLDLLDEVKRQYPSVPVVMISGHGNIEMAVNAIRRGAYDFIEKPFKTDRLLLLVERAIEAAHLRREIAQLKQRAGVDAELIGSSNAISNLNQQISRVAPTGSRVLITGPAGAGKEVLARLLHARSKRANGPFVVLNCAALHPDRLEEELFGVENDDGEGPRKIGTLEQADGGTLLLDEIADMPLATQGKIVRVLQDQSFIREGGQAHIEVDVRVIASSNRDIPYEIQEGHFREDLYYRLNVVPIRVPALAERTDDIPALCEYFMGRSAEMQGLPPREIGADAMAALQAYGWPGNVRQLRNVIDWLLIMAGGDTDKPLHADMLPPEIGSITPAVLKLDKGTELMSLALRDAREMFEREYLMSQLNRFNRNISRTAEFVGMERSALHRKLKSLGVHVSDRVAKVVTDDR